jgi:hypothetical protein
MCERSSSVSLDVAAELGWEAGLIVSVDRH